MLRRLASPRIETLSAPPQDVERRWKLSGSDTTFTGDNVTPDNATGVPAVLACVSVLTEDCASLPWFLYERQARGRTLAVNQSLYVVLHDAANPEMTSMSYREIIVGHICTWGNSYSQIITDRAGRVMELWPLRPDRMQVFRDGKLKKYLYTDRFEAPHAFTADEILHIPGFGFDGLIGYSKIQIARQSIAIMMATEKYVGAFFANDARPGIVLEYPQKLSDKAIENITKSWNLSYQGAGKRSKVAIAEEGLKIHEVGLPPNDSQFVEVKAFGLEEICRIFRMPPHKVQHLNHATFSNIEHQGIEYVTDTLRPWLVRIEQAVNLQLLTAQERKQFYNEILVEGLLRGDTAARYGAYAIGRQWGWLSANDVRERENMNPIDTGGDEYLVPLNMVTAGETATPNANQVDAQSRNRLPVDRFGDELRNRRASRTVGIRRRMMTAEKKVIKDVALRICRREAHDVGEAARKMLKPTKRDAESFSRWLEQFYREHQNFVQKQFAPTMTAYGEMVAGAAGDEVGADGWDAGTEKFVREYITSYAQRHVGISEAEMFALIQKAVAAADDFSTLDDDLSAWADTRSDVIAGAESVRENNAVAKAVYMAAGFTTLVWVANSSACDYCASLNGQTVSVFSNFLHAGEDYQPGGTDRPLKPSGNVGHPPAHAGCECLAAAWN